MTGTLERRPMVIDSPAAPANAPRGVSLPDLLERSIRRGQKRVALQRLLMMEAAGLQVSEASRTFCHALRMAIPRRELDRMYAAADAWARMIGLCCNR